jgi:hypothetical protein
VGERIDVVGATAKIRLHGRHHRQTPLRGGVGDAEDGIRPRTLLGAELQPSVSAQARGDALDTLPAPRGVLIEPEVRAVERGVAARMVGERRGQRDVTLGDGLGIGRVVRVLPEEVDGCGESDGMKRSDGGDRIVLVDPRDVPLRATKGQAAQRRRSEDGPFDPITGRQPEGGAAAEATQRPLRCRLPRHLVDLCATR